MMADTGPWAAAEPSTSTWRRARASIPLPHAAAAPRKKLLAESSATRRLLHETPLADLHHAEPGLLPAVR